MEPIELNADPSDRVNGEDPIFNINAADEEKAPPSSYGPRFHCFSYEKGTRSKQAAEIYLEHLYYERHEAFPSRRMSSWLRFKHGGMLRKTHFGVETYDAVILGDDPLISLCTAYSLATRKNARVLIFPTAKRIPQGDTQEQHEARVKYLYHADKIGDLIKGYLGVDPNLDFSDYEAAIFSMIRACESLNAQESRIMLAHGYSLTTDRTKPYEIPDENDENLTQQLFYADPDRDVSNILFYDDWQIIRQDLLNHTLPREAYEGKSVITEILAKCVFITSPLPIGLDGHIMCQHYQIASGLQSISQVLEHADFGYGHRFLDVISGVSADLFMKGEISAQDFIQKYSLHDPV